MARRQSFEDAVRQLLHELMNDLRELGDKTPEDHWPLVIVLDVDMSETESFKILIKWDRRSGGPSNPSLN